MQWRAASGGGGGGGSVAGYGNGGGVRGASEPVQNVTAFRPVRQGRAAAGVMLIYTGTTSNNAGNEQRKWQEGASYSNKVINNAKGWGNGMVATQQLANQNELRTGTYMLMGNGNKPRRRTRSVIVRTVTATMLRKGACTGRMRNR